MPWSWPNMPRKIAPPARPERLGTAIVVGINVNQFHHEIRIGAGGGDAHTGVTGPAMVSACSSGSVS